MPDRPAAVPTIESRAAATSRTNIWLVIVAGWLVPGAGHVLVGAPRKAVTFLGLSFVMLAAGLAFGGRLFPFATSEPLVFLAAAAQWSVFIPRVIAGMAGWGAGEVVAATYEYGNTFLIVAGLLNVLVFFDAFDRARGRRAS